MFRAYFRFNNMSGSIMIKLEDISCFLSYLQDKDENYVFEKVGEYIDD